MLATRPAAWAAPARALARGGAGSLSVRGRTAAARVPAVRRQSTIRCAAGAKPAEAPASAYDALKGCKVYRASDGELVDISTQWSENETCVVSFLRSFGEAAIQLRRDVLPVLERSSVKLLCVSIGTPQRAKDFVAETGFPAEILFADPENATYDALRLHKGWGRTFGRIETPFSIKDRIQADGAADLCEILPRWKPWLPPKSDQGLQQGGTFVFKGRKAVFEHYDESTGAHANFADVMAAAGCPPA